MNNFGTILKKLRIQSNLTQKQLAERIGVTKSVVSYYESQERYPSPDILVKIAKVFHVTTDYLLGIDTKKTINVSELSPEDISFIIKTIDFLKSKY